MAYALLADVEMEFPGTTFGASDMVSEADIEAFIDQESAFIDSFLAGRYTVPVASGAVSLLLLKKYCVQLVAARVSPKLAIGNAEKRQAALDSSKDIHEAIVKALSELRTGVATLPDAGRANSPISESYNRANNYEGPFTIEQDW